MIMIGINGQQIFQKNRLFKRSFFYHFLKTDQNKLEIPVFISQNSNPISILIFVVSRQPFDGRNATCCFSLEVMGKNQIFI